MAVAASDGGAGEPPQAEPVAVPGGAAWRQPGPVTMDDVAAQVWGVDGVDDLTKVTVKEVRERIERAKNFPPQSLLVSPYREQVASLLEESVTRKRKEFMEKEKQEWMDVHDLTSIHERVGKLMKVPDLKEECKSRGLDAGGKKPALVKRLHDFKRPRLLGSMDGPR